MRTPGVWYIYYGDVTGDDMQAVQINLYEQLTITKWIGYLHNGPSTALVISLFHHSKL